MTTLTATDITFDDLFISFVQEKFGIYFFIYISIYNFFILLLFILYPLLEHYYTTFVNASEVTKFVSD